MHLRTDYIDSYVLHAPYSRRGLGPADRAGWRAMEDLYASGKTKMIGVSNITAPQLEQLCGEARVQPMMVQNRCFAVLGWDHEVRLICRNRGIIYQGFSLLTANPEVVADRRVATIALRLGVAPAQIIFAFALAVGMLPLTGTTNGQHMKQDLAAAELQLAPEEIDYIEAMAV
jgi:diketogulonate reductase-like aldo/keto reductase